MTREELLVLLEQYVDGSIDAEGARILSEALVAGDDTSAWLQEQLASIGGLGQALDPVSDEQFLGGLRERMSARTNGTRFVADFTRRLRADRARRAAVGWGLAAAGVLILAAGLVTISSRPATDRTNGANVSREGPTGPATVDTRSPPRPPDTSRPGPAPAPHPPGPEPRPPQPEPGPGPQPVPQPQPPAPEPPQPVPPKSGATQPEPPGPKPPEPAPKRELAAVRLLDVTGELAIAKKRVVEGQLTREPVTAVTVGAFRVEGDLVALLKGTVATVGRVGPALSLEVGSGEVCVESDGAGWILGGRELTLKGRAIVSPLKVEMLAEMSEKDATKRAAPYKTLRPRQRTWLFEDFADREGGILAAALNGSNVSADVPVPLRRAPYGRNLVVRFRYRTNAPMLQVLMRIEGRTEPWAAPVGTKRGAWQELVVPVTRFSGGPSGAPEPAAGAKVQGLGFGVKQADVTKEQAFLEIDDVVLLERE